MLVERGPGSVTLAAVVVGEQMPGDHEHPRADARARRVEARPRPQHPLERGRGEILGDVARDRVGEERVHRSDVLLVHRAQLARPGTGAASARIAPTSSVARPVSGDRAACGSRSQLAPTSRNVVTSRPHRNVFAKPSPRVAVFARISPALSGLTGVPRAPMARSSLRVDDLLRPAAGLRPNDRRQERCGAARAAGSPTASGLLELLDYAGRQRLLERGRGGEPRSPPGSGSGWCAVLVRHRDAFLLVADRRSAPRRSLPNARSAAATKKRHYARISRTLTCTCHAPQP